MRRALHVVLAAWAGSLWTVCGLVAPTLFRELSDRALAGQVAGALFTSISWLGLALGLIVLILLVRGAHEAANRMDYIIAFVTLTLPLLSELLLRPLMESARAAQDMQRFGMLHGMSMLLFGIACIGALLLVWRLAALPGRNG